MAGRRSDGLPRLPLGCGNKKVRLHRRRGARGRGRWEMGRDVAAAAVWL